MIETIVDDDLLDDLGLGGLGGPTAPPPTVTTTTTISLAPGATAPPYVPPPPPAPTTAAPPATVDINIDDGEGDSLAVSVDPDELLGAGPTGVTTVANSTDENGTVTSVYVNIAIENKTVPIIEADMSFDFDMQDTNGTTPAPGSISAVMKQPGFTETCLESSAALVSPHLLCASFRTAIRNSLCASANLVLTSSGHAPLLSCSYIVILGITLLRSGVLVLRQLGAELLKGEVWKAERKRPWERGGEFFPWERGGQQSVQEVLRNLLDHTGPQTKKLILSSSGKNSTNDRRHPRTELFFPASSITTHDAARGGHRHTYTTILLPPAPNDHSEAPKQAISPLISASAQLNLQRTPATPSPGRTSSESRGRTRLLTSSDGTTITGSGNQSEYSIDVNYQIHYPPTYTTESVRAMAQLMNDNSTMFADTFRQEMENRVDAQVGGALLMEENRFHSMDALGAVELFAIASY